MLKALTSAANPLIKLVVSLHESKARKEMGLCIVEGQRALETALQGLKLETLYCTEPLIPAAESLAPSSKITVVTEPLMKKMSTATTPSGLLGVVHIPSAYKELTSGIVLAKISDPGNMGTLIRTAAACSVRSVVIIEGTDPWSPKAVQASAGTIGLVNIFQWDWKTLLQKKGTFNLAALIVEGGAPCTTLNPQNDLIVVGNEATGIPAEWIASCEKRVTLEMPGNTESLNAAVAGSIALYLTFVA